MVDNTLVMQDIIDKGFRSHPVIIREIQLFLLEQRVDRSQLLLVDKTSKEARDKSGKLESLLEKTRQELGSLKAAVAKLPKKS